MRAMVKVCVRHNQALVCDPKPSEKCTKLTKCLALVDTLWNPEKGPDSRISLLGWLRAQWRRQMQVQELEAEGIKGT